MSYPPFCDMVALTVTADSEADAHSVSRELSKSLLSMLEEEFSGLPFVVYGPFEAQVYKLNDKYRMKMVLKCKLNSETRRLFHELLSEFSTVRGATLSVDLNPLTV
jgi:primosomal protein N' (replication factor Y)